MLREREADDGSRVKGIERHKGVVGYPILLFLSHFCWCCIPVYMMLQILYVVYLSPATNLKPFCCINLQTQTVFRFG